MRYSTCGLPALICGEMLLHLFISVQPRYGGIRALSMKAYFR
jgi:hypothetical protein